MSNARHKLILINLLLLGSGLVVGWLYGYATVGLLIAALVSLFWQIRQVLIFERALRTNNFEQLRYGEGIWSQVYSRISHFRRRGKLHKRRYRELAKEIRKSANALPDGGIILNQEFEILLCNTAAEKLVGFRRRGDRGRRVDNILRDPAFGAYLKSEKFDEAVEVRSPVTDGAWISCRIVPYGANQRLLLIRDITGPRRLTSMRREFVANASHELRSPLTVISGYLDTMVDDPDVADDWRNPLQQMQVQAHRMNNIVAELLELSRMEGAGAAPDDVVVDIAGLLAAAKKAFAGQQGAANIEVDIQSSARLNGSSAELESVITNLLSNAIRYTAETGTVVMSWSSNESGAELAVSDTGIGIEQEYIPRLTERFFRIDQGRGRDEGGVGLGLAIVKHILERHAATLTIESTPGQGSRFICHFPLERIATTEATPILPNVGAR